MPTTTESLGPEIVDVELSFRTTLVRNYLKTIIIWIVAGLVWGYLIFYFFGYSERTLMVSLIPLFGLFIYLGIIRERVVSKFYQQFALANGYTYSKIGTGIQGEAGLFQVGESRIYSHVVSGKFQNHPIAFFNYQYTTGSGKNRSTHQFTVFELDYGHQLPKVFLRSDKNWLSFIMPMFDTRKRLKLEGDFDDYFDLFVEKKFEIEALQIFTPDVMHQLMTDWKKMSMESINDKIYIYIPGQVTKKSILDSMHSMAKYLIDKLAPVIQGMESSTIAMQERMKS